MTHTTKQFPGLVKFRGCASEPDACDAWQSIRLYSTLLLKGIGLQSIYVTTLGPSCDVCFQTPDKTCHSCWEKKRQLAIRGHYYAPKEFHPNWSDIIFMFFLQGSAIGNRLAGGWLRRRYGAGIHIASLSELQFLQGHGSRSVLIWDPLSNHGSGQGGSPKK